VAASAAVITSCLVPQIPTLWMSFVLQIAARLWFTASPPTRFQHLPALQTRATSDSISDRANSFTKQGV
jgi:hypothetical protein